MGTVHFAGDRAAGEVIAALGLDVPPGLARSRRMQRRYAPVFPWA